MSILIAYASIDGQTGKIAHHLAHLLRKSGHELSLVDVGDRAAEVSYQGVSRVILAAPVHERRHPKAFEVYLSADREALDRHRTLMISVSLKAAFSKTREEAQDFLEEMKLRTGLEPDAELLVAGAVHPQAYDYYADQILRHVVLRGQTIDPHTEHEFTDWDALDRDVLDFVSWAENTA